MKYHFDPNGSFIAVEVVLVGPLAFGKTIFALDTGATQTGVDESILGRLGFGPSMAVRKLQVATAGGQTKMFEYRLPVLSALGLDVHDFDVLAVDLSASSFDGVLGMDFFRDKVLTIDFRNATIELV